MCCDSLPSVSRHLVKWHRCTLFVHFFYGLVYRHDDVHVFPSNCCDIDSNTDAYASFFRSQVSRSWSRISWDKVTRYSSLKIPQIWERYYRQLLLWWQFCCWDVLRAALVPQDNTANFVEEMITILHKEVCILLIGRKEVALTAPQWSLSSC